MGGYTTIHLKNVTQSNIAIENEKLKLYGIPTKYHFYSLNDVRMEYETFKKGEGYFPEREFSRDKIKTFADFRKCWNNKQLPFFCPKFGTLAFDCYFGRTSIRTMQKIGKYITENLDNFECFSGSFDTFMERGMNQKQIKLFNQLNLKY
jgi:hypothetical protein